MIETATKKPPYNSHGNPSINGASITILYLQFTTRPMVIVMGLNTRYHSRQGSHHRLPSTRYPTKSQLRREISLRFRLRRKHSKQMAPASSYKLSKLIMGTRTSLVLLFSKSRWSSLALKSNKIRKVSYLILVLTQMYWKMEMLKKKKVVAHSYL